MIKLIQLSDCHLLKDKNKTGYAGIAPYDSLERTLLHAVNHAEQFEANNSSMAPSCFMLITGDISGDNTPESYQHFIALMDKYVDRANIAWFVLAGNHDNNAHFETYLGDKQLNSDNPLTFQNWHIHGMDTRALDSTYTAAGEVKGGEIHDLTQAVAQLPDNNHLIALHHHILPSNSWMDKHFLANAEALVSLTEQYAQVKALIHGHVHSPLRQLIGENSTPSYGCPSTCWQWEMQLGFGVSNDAPGYQVIELQEDGVVDVSIERVEH